MKETKFKQTEVGMIPSDWEVIKLCDLCYLITKQTGFDYSAAIKPSLVRNSSSYTLPFIQNKDFEGTKINFETDFYIPKSVAINYPKILLNEPVLLISISGRIGNVAYFSHQKDAFIGGAVGVARFNDKRLIEWTNLYLQSVDGQTQIFANEKSGAQHNLTIADVRNLKIAFPKKIEEQQRVANALSDVDTLIANLEKLIAKKKNIKQGAMQQLLTGRKRLPGFGSDERQKECHSERSAKREIEKSSGYKMTELGLIPSDWEVKTFGELFDILPNNTLSRAELNEDSGSFKNVHYGDVLVKFPEWIDCSKNTLPFINSGAKFNHTALQDGDVIIADTAEDETVGKSTEIYNVGKMKIVSGLHTIPIRPKKKFASKWLGYFINSACWHDQILPFITGTKVSAISKTAIAETKFFYPAKIDEQTAIANVLSDMDAEISALETKLAKYRTLKTGMMQQLLTGKIRLIK